MILQWSLGNVLEQAKQGSSGSMGRDVFVSPGSSGSKEDDDDEDEDDASWRVRRQALRVVRAFIQSRPEMLSTMYRRCVGADGGEGAGTLVSRFSERHDQVRVEIIMAVRELFEKSTMRHRALLTINANSALSEVAKDQALRTLKVRVYVVLFFIMVCVVVVWVVWNGGGWCCLSRSLFANVLVAFLCLEVEQCQPSPQIAAATKRPHCVE